MSNFRIVFSHPWLLLILLALFATTLIPYFLLSKRHRRTRNRITSIVLHLLVGVMAITLLAGMKFTYDIPNVENEIIILVDVSESLSMDDEFEKNRDDYVQGLINFGKEDGYKMGIVTYAYGYDYAVPLTHDLDGIYEDYIKYFNECKLDRTATDLNSALVYARDLISYPDTAKIVIVSDGRETDRDAREVIRGITAKGIKIDAAFVNSGVTQDDAQIVGLKYEEDFITPGVPCPIKITVNSNGFQTVTFEISDNGELMSEETIQVDLYKGPQDIVIQHTFPDDGSLHEIAIKMSDGDAIYENNVYYSYYNFAKYTKVLVLEAFAGQSERLDELLTSKNYDVTVKNLYTAEDLPKSVNDLRAYDQVILNNVANRDISDQTNGNVVEGFDALLYSYVNDYGGGLLTFGGKDDNGEANAYNWTDMPGTIYQEMLPVQAVKYTPPVAVMVIVDISGSMTTTDDATGRTKLEWAQQGAESCYNALTERDYFGLMTCESYQGTILDLTPCTNRNKILGAIHGEMPKGGGTSFSTAIEAAGQKLAAQTNVARRHIILVSDGALPDSDFELSVENIVNNYNAAEITFSFVAIGISDSDVADMETATDKGHGRFYNIADLTRLTDTMREDVCVDEIKSVVTEPFIPTIVNGSTYVTKGVETDEESISKMTVELGGFFGTKVKDYGYLILSGDYGVPLYAQRELGLGRVGSFMCDVYSDWSKDFMRNENGIKVISNIVENLMPKADIRPNPMSVTLKADNYTNDLIVYGNLEEGEKVEASIVNPMTDVVISLNALAADDEATTFCTVLSPLSSDNQYSRCSFVVKEGGVYKIIAKKIDASGNVVSETTLFKTFSYSEEYNVDYAEEDYEDAVNVGREDLNKLTTLAKGKLIEEFNDIFLIFDDFDPHIHKEYDPRFLFMILAIIFFLLDIAVRKFKFKWPHEIIRDIKNKKSK